MEEHQGRDSPTAKWTEVIKKDTRASGADEDTVMDRIVEKIQVGDPVRVG